LVVLLAAASALATTAGAALPEFTPVFPKPFISEGGVSKFETVGKDKIECASEKDAGTITGPKEGTTTLMLKGCKLTIPGAIFPCNTEGAAPEEIVTLPLKTTLGYITHTPLKTVVGLELGFGEAPIASIECLAPPGPLHVLVIGSFIGKITPIKKVVKPFPAGHFTLTFTEAAGKQKPKNFEGLPPDLFLTKIGAGAFEETGYASKDIVGFPEPVTIAA
jgi:hypothetical protein